MNLQRTRAHHLYTITKGKGGWGGYCGNKGSNLQPPQSSVTPPPSWIKPKFALIITSNKWCPLALERVGYLSWLEGVPDEITQLVIGHFPTQALHQLGSPHQHFLENTHTTTSQEGHQAQHHTAAYWLMWRMISEKNTASAQHFLFVSLLNV